MTKKPVAAANMVALSDPDPAWPLAYERERRAIVAALAPIGPLYIEHIGSTAIPQIRAKPIIDIMVGAADYSRFAESRRCLEAMGYEYDAAALDDEPGRHVFRKGLAGGRGLRTHHLHFTLFGGAYWLRILAFRDCLRANEAVAMRYEELKTELARNFARDSRAYTRGKASFVRRIEGLALPAVRRPSRLCYYWPW